MKSPKSAGWIGTLALLFQCAVQGAELPPSLAADAAVLTSPPGKWQSAITKVKSRTGQWQEDILAIEFDPAPRTGQTNAPEAQAKLFTTTPTKGIPGLATVNASLGDGSFRDVRLQETNGVRTITITRAVPENDSKPAKTKRIYDRFYSVSFRYELKDQVLTLTGFPTTNKVSWGVSEFIMSEPDLVFKKAP